MRFRAKDVRAFRDRDWSAFERSEPVLSADRSEALAASLYEQVRAARPDWPTVVDRDEDLAAHLRLVEVFARIRSAGRRSVDAR